MSLYKGWITERTNKCVSETHKTVEKEDDSETWVLILNSSMNIKHIANVHTQILLINYFQATGKTI